MKAYARIQNGVVSEVFRTDALIFELFHPDLLWVEIPPLAEVSEGWTYDGAAFLKPVPVEASPIIPSITQILEELKDLRAIVGRLDAAAHPNARNPD